MNLYYRKIEYNGLENIPEDGPVLIYSNHPNALIDPVLILTKIDRKVTLTVTSQLSSIPLLGGLLRRLNVLFIHRRSDGHSEKVMKHNSDTIVNCANILQEKRMLLIFPEGRSYPDNKLREFKTGIVRIINEYESRNSVQLTILPVYIHYLSKSRFRSDVSVNFLPHEKSILNSELDIVDKVKKIRGNLVEQEVLLQDKAYEKEQKLTAKILLLGFQGLVLSLLPVTLIYILAEFIAKKEEQIDTTRVALSFLLLPLLYLMQLFIVFTQLSLAFLGMISLISIFINYLSIKFMRSNNGKISNINK